LSTLCHRFETSLCVSVLGGLAVSQDSPGANDVAGVQLHHLLEADGEDIHGVGLAVCTVRRRFGLKLHILTKQTRYSASIEIESIDLGSREAPPSSARPAASR